MNRRPERELPILTDVVQLRAGQRPSPPAGSAEDRYLPLSGTSVAALQAELVSRTLDVTGELLHNAAREMEAVMFERVLDRLRAVLPDLVDEALRQYQSTERGD